MEYVPPTRSASINHVRSGSSICVNLVDGLLSTTRDQSELIHCLSPRNERTIEKGKSEYEAIRLIDPQHISQQSSSIPQSNNSISIHGILNGGQV